MQDTIGVPDTVVAAMGIDSKPPVYAPYVDEKEVVQLNVCVTYAGRADSGSPVRDEQLQTVYDLIDAVIEKKVLILLSLIIIYLLCTKSCNSRARVLCEILYIIIKLLYIIIYYYILLYSIIY